MLARPLRREIPGHPERTEGVSFLLNILWIILGGGWLICLEYLAAGVVLCLTVVGIPFGLQCFKLAKLGGAQAGRRVSLVQTLGTLAGSGSGRVAAPG